MTRMTGEQAARGLAVGRTFAGAAAWLAPDLAARMLGAAEGPTSRFALRLFGVRDVAMGVGYLTASAVEQQRWLAIGMVVDAADAVAALAAQRQGLLQRTVGVLVAVTALTAAGTAAWSRRQSPVSTAR